MIWHNGYKYCYTFLIDVLANFERMIIKLVDKNQQLVIREIMIRRTKSKSWIKQEEDKEQED